MPARHRKAGLFFDFVPIDIGNLLEKFLGAVGVDRSTFAVVVIVLILS